MEAKKFVNFTNEEFTWKFNGIPFTFKPNQEMYLEAEKAEHFAKHLVDKEMNRLNIPTNMMAKRNELLEKCFPTDEVVTPLEALNIEEGKKARTPKAKKAEEPEFEDLNK